ncbi:sugar kinase [Chenggangzhangella methanolivorans]|uniref:Sugar kinase n=1 Tax=Chenggangzhangella methanolivorans TaxID=1437009 RepID=A0A9E6R9N5_9HYPH|nr:sugar kinase [Chenggangzhangella methanolivorans]QZN99864.1 sugar kinase [Chenggangzhangella methanolivorans]
MSGARERIVLVTRATRLDDLVARFNTVEQAKFYVEHLGADFSDYLAEHDRYREAVTIAEQSLARFGRVQRIDREFLPNFLFPPDALVVALGQDGLVANTLKYLDRQPLVGVNPDPGRWEGVLLPFGPEDLDAITAEALADRRPFRTVTMARARLTDGQELHAVNDLFIGPASHVSARYRIEVGEESENQSSSGVIVSTGLGSTGWFRSLIAGATGIAGGRKKAVGALRENGFPWDADHLYFTVREPFPSRASEASIVFGRVERGAPLKIVSQMPDYGVIFSDGVEADFLKFNSGMEAVIGVADRSGTLVL